MEKRLGFDPAQKDSEGAEEAVAAGRAMRERQRGLLTQVPELPDRYDPSSDSEAPPTKRNRIRLPSTSSARPPSRRSSSPHPDASPAKLRRVRLPSNSEEDLPSELRRHPLRIDSDSESERPPLEPHTISQRAFNMVLDEETRAPIPIEPSGPSHGGEAKGAPTTRETERKLSSDDDESIGPSLGIVHRERGERHRSHARTRRRVANPFIQFEAEDGDDDESGSEMESSPLSSEADPDSDSIFDSDSDSDE